MDSASFILGSLTGVLIYGICGFFLINNDSKYKSLIRELRYLIKENSQMVTLTDLVLKTGLSSNYCRKFLNKFVVELDGNIQYTDAGKLFYQFPNSNSLQPASNSNYRYLVRYTESLADSNQGIVTLTDLVWKSELSPSECREFLDGLVEELNGKVGQTQSGQVYYQFPKLEKSELKQIRECELLKQGN